MIEVPNKLANGPGLSLLKARSQRFPGGAQSCAHYYSVINFGAAHVAYLIRAF